jgi:hypothetical protein
MPSDGELYHHQPAPTTSAAQIASTRPRRIQRLERRRQPGTAAEWTVPNCCKRP